MDWKQLVQFALLGSSDLEQYAILLTGHLRMLVDDPGSCAAERLAYLD